MSRSRDWVILALIAAGVCAYLTLRPERPSSEGKQHPAVGMKPGLIELQALTGDSTSVTLDDLQGKVVLLNFWGTWCPPCVQEFPHIVDMWQEYRDQPDFRLLAVSCGYDGNDTNLDELRAETDAFLKRANATLPTYADEGGTTRVNFINQSHNSDFGYPATMILDRAGVIRGFWLGYKAANVRQMESLIEELLKEKAKPPT